MVPCENMEKYMPLPKVLNDIIAASMLNTMILYYYSSKYRLCAGKFLFLWLFLTFKASLWSSGCSQMAKKIYSNASLCVLTNEAYRPFRASSSKWVPSSTIFPSEQNAIWWAFWTVLNRCAITNVVLPFIRWFSASWTSRSLTASRALVAYTKKDDHHNPWLGWPWIPRSSRLHKRSLL